ALRGLVGWGGAGLRGVGPGDPVDGDVAAQGPDPDPHRGVAGRSRLTGQVQPVAGTADQAAEVEPHPGAGGHADRHVAGESVDAYVALLDRADLDVAGGGLDVDIRAGPVDLHVTAAAPYLDRAVDPAGRQVAGAGLD